MKQQQWECKIVTVSLEAIEIVVMTALNHGYKTK